MVVSIVLILLVAALIMVLWNAANGQIHLWVPVLLICIVLLLTHLPLK